MDEEMFEGLTENEIDDVFVMMEEKRERDEEMMMDWELERGDKCL